MTPSNYLARIKTLRRDATLQSTDLENFPIIDRIKFTVEWIQQANKAVSNRGISKGFDLIRNRWAPAYPETTGYTIPTLINASRLLEEPRLKALAFSLADFLIENSTPEGGVVHWEAETKSNPVIFDTGQVIFGWLAAYKDSQDSRYLESAIQAGNWIISNQDDSGSWKKYQHLNVEKVIDARVAWALLLLSRHSEKAVFQEAAEKNLKWAMQQQTADGWFRRCSFLEGRDPFTHTLAYTAEGLLECGFLLGEDRYVEAGKRTADAALAQQHANGSLTSTYGPSWKKTSQSSCLTGNCQFGRLWLFLYEKYGDSAYLDAAFKAVRFVASTQDVSTNNPNIFGGIAGSYPIYGLYERFKFPNWAAKFYIDALIALLLVSGKQDCPLAKG